MDAYIAAAASAAQPALRRIREIFRAAAPDAAEIISYKMPAFRGHGILIYFGAFKSHIGLFPPVGGDAPLLEALARYRGPKGNLQFPLDEPLPEALIQRIARLRAEQDQAKADARKQRRRSPS
ncbi:MAG: iron chaperone [Caulobacterales bacterium]